MKKTTLNTESNLARYSAVAAAVLAANVANSQVQYTDLSPDVTVTAGSPYSLDLNSDATPDFSFSINVIATSVTMYGAPVPVNGNIASMDLFSGNAAIGVQESFAYGQYVALSPTVLATGAAIDGAAVWGSTATGLLAYSGVATFLGNQIPLAGGNWGGLTDGYMGVRFVASGNNHYGWVRLSVAANATSITIKDFAYQASVNCAINAGASTGAPCTSGLETVDLNQKITVTNQYEAALVNVTPDLMGGKLSLLNSLGVEISKIEIRNLNTTIPFENLASGIYFINAQFEQGQITKKIFVK
jgi:hypothetical protein